MPNFSSNKQHVKNLDGAGKVHKISQAGWG